MTMQNTAPNFSSGCMANADRLRRRAKVRRKKLSPEDIDRLIEEVAVYRQAGVSLGIACCHAGVSEETYRKWISTRAHQSARRVAEGAGVPAEEKEVS